MKTSSLTKNILALATAFYLLSNIGLSQSGPSKITLQYNVQHLIDTIDNFRITYPLLVIANNDHSYSISKNKYENDSLLNSNPAKINKIGETYMVDAPQYVLKRLTTFESAVIYTYVQEKKIVEEVTVGSQQYLIIDSTLEITWNIKDLFKDINGYRCQYAECNYKGRLWYAWYAIELPIATGSWKLHGLPGAILEANDSKNEVIFAIKEITFEPRSISRPGNYDYINRITYFKLLQAYADDPIAFLGNKFGVNLKLNDFQFDNGRSASPKKKLKVPNNPIELE